MERYHPAKNAHETKATIRVSADAVVKLILTTPS